MIIKGTSHTGRGLGTYLQNKKNEHVDIWRIRGDIERDLSKTLNDWRSDSLGTKCSKPLYHAQINPNRVLSLKEWETAIEIFEKEMSFEKQPRAVILHKYKGREHIHLVYSRIDENGKAISDSWNYLCHEKASREIEQALGLEYTKGALYKREGKRPERIPTQNAIQQGERLKIDPCDLKAEISLFFQNTDNGNKFISRLESKGYSIAKGDSHTYVIIDEKGGIHSLSKMAGVNVATLRERLSKYPLETLPEAKDLLFATRQKQQEFIKTLDFSKQKHEKYKSLEDNHYLDGGRERNLF